jgi:hypothetical protein
MPRFARRIVSSVHGRAANLLLLLGPAYIAAVSAVVGVEYWSELGKINRGVSTDTFSPTLYSQLVTLPGSALVAGKLPSYPVAFAADIYRHVLTVRVRELLLIGLAQGTLVTLAAIAIWFKRQRNAEA